jgi:hypothetical protein
MEPASAVGGDTFDYALGEDALQVSITDAAGHDAAAALLATLLVGSLRNGRRRGGACPPTTERPRRGRPTGSTIMTNSESGPPNHRSTPYRSSARLDSASGLRGRAD